MSASDIEAIQTAALRLTNAPRKQGFSLYPKDGGAIHRYTAPDGSITFARIRLKNPDTGDKWIRPLRRDTSGVWCELKAPEFAGGAPLYCLHQLSDTARQSERVILTEGEYKADMLAARGILATTSGGAQSVDATDWQPLTGRNVLVWADNDKAGFEYAKQAADKLRALGCAVAFIDVAAFNLPPKGDAVDWLKAFNQQHGRKATAADVWALPVIDLAPKTAETVEAVESVLSPFIVACDADVLPESAAPADAVSAQSDDETIQWLATLKPLEYERVRGDQAKAMNCRPAVLDSLVKAARNEESEAERLPFAEVEPHPEEIDPAQLLDEVSGTIRQFIVLDTEQAHAAALWVAFTWFIDFVEVAPLLIITAPEMACGKSQLRDLLSKIVRRPLSTNNMKAATLFRIAEKWHPSLMLDEVDLMLKSDDEIINLVNAGHHRGASQVWRLVGDNHEPKSFDVWGAKCFAGIALEKIFPASTLSRSIVIKLRRKLSHESVLRLRYADGDVFVGIAEKLARFAADYSQQVKQARPSLPDVLSDRDQDNWECLLSIASCAGDVWLARATAAALKLSGAGEKMQSTGNELLADIQHVFETKKLDKISTVDLIAALCADEELSWNTYNRGRQLAPRQLSNRLKEYGITSKQMRFNNYDNPARGFEREQFIETFERYLSAQADTPKKLPLHVTKPLEANSNIDFLVTDRKPCNVTEILSVTTKPNKDGACNAVTAKTPILGVGESSLKNASHLRI